MMKKGEGIVKTCEETLRGRGQEEMLRGTV